uniref:Uncharacterized protein n=1 Tax=Oncorhynchus tshawytscha TaxID=74940 RepID=A0AAZ3QW33_ONCTS
METVDMERVRRNQENISLVKHKKQLQAPSVGVTSELERVRQNQENISSVKYQRGKKEMKGRSCGELDTPGLSSVRESQNDI